MLTVKTSFIAEWIFQAERGQRIVLVGPMAPENPPAQNPCWCSDPAKKGERTLGHNVKAGYYSQYRVDMLIPERTVLEEGLDTPQRVTEQFVRTLLGSFLFRAMTVSEGECA